MKVQEKREQIGTYDKSVKRIDGSTPGWSMAREYYKDPAIFEKELPNVIYDSWVFAGHVSQIPNAGDYIQYKLMDESAIIVRTAAGEVKAFYNVCRHRGSAICKESHGNVKRFTCPYHAWTFSLDGDLIAARGMPDDFEKDMHKLHVCAMEIIDGLIFVNFSDNPDSMDNCRRDMKEPMAQYDFANMKVAAHKNYPIAANWKVTLENYQECYHCAPSHPEYALMHTLKVDADKFDALQGKMMDRMPQCNVKHYEVDKQFDMKDEGQEQYAYSRYALFEKYLTGSEDGQPVAPLLGDFTGFDKGASDMNFGPFTYMLCYNDHVVVYVFTPTSHEESACDIYWLVRADAEEGKDYDVERLTWLWHVTTLADERIIVDNQQGINSKKYQPGPLASMEYLVDKMITWYLSRLMR